MQVPDNTKAIFKIFALGFLALLTLMLSGCESVSKKAGSGYYSEPPMTPIEGASMMQSRLGQITRSQIR